MDTAAVAGEDARGSVGGTPLFRFLIRLVLVALAVGALWFAQDRHLAFTQEASANFDWNLRLWFTYGAALLLAGLAFGLAVWLPFSKVRYMPSRLAFAAIALVPFLKTSMLLIQLEQGGQLLRWWSWPRWFDDPAILALSTALAGVAIASGFRSKSPDQSSSS